MVWNVDVTFAEASTARQSNAMAIKRYRFILYFFASLLVGCGSSGPDAEGYYCDAETTEIYNGKKSFICKNARFHGGDAQSDEEARSGKYSAKLNKENAYGMVLKVTGLSPGDRVEASVWRKGPKNKGFLIMSGENSSFLYRKEQDIAEVDENGWEQIRMVATLPPNYDPEVPISVYAWHNGEEAVYFDDLRFHDAEPAIEDPASEISLILPNKTNAHFNDLRNQALKVGQMNQESNEWQKAKVLNKGDTMKTKIRLKGDWLDHFLTEKWSLRLKMKKDKRWNRLRTFSLQNPVTRGFLKEWVFHEMLKQEGVLTTRYGFIPVKINGHNMGVYAYEEHFEKHLLEAQNRREGPIMKLNEDGLFELNRATSKNKDWPVMPMFEAAEVLPFKETSILEDPGLSEQFRLGRNLMHLYKQGIAPASEIFDLQSLARFAAIVDVCRAFHSSRWHNQRFYYNPVTSRLEPVAYDGYTQKGVFDNHRPPITALIQDVDEVIKQKNAEDLLFLNLFNDSTFAQAYADALEVYSSQGFIEEFLAKHASEIDKYEKWLKADSPYYTYDRDFLTNNAAAIREKLPQLKEKLARENLIGKNLIAESGQDYEPCFGQGPLSHIGVKAFQKSPGRKLTLTLTNYHCAPVKVIGAGQKGIKMLYTLDEPLVLPRHTSTSGKVSTDLTLDAVYKWLYLQVDDNDSLYRVEIHHWQEPNGGSPRLGLFTQKALQSSPAYRVHPSIISFNSGKHVISEPIVIPQGYRVDFLPGAQLEFVRGAFFISYSPVFMRGTEASPIVISSPDGSAGGFTLLQCDQRSLMQHVHFKGMNSLNYEGWSLPGAVTCYESDLDVAFCRFENNHCEDALNTFRSDFRIKNSVFEKTFGDAFDADFCTGELLDSEFILPGNDGIDFSGSEIEISGCRVEKAGDKGISIGEASTVALANTTVDGAAIGLSSKDLSKVIIRDITLRNCDYGLGIFQKKAEYGPAHIEGSGLILEEVNFKVALDKGSTLKTDTESLVGKEKIDVDALFY